MGTYLPSSAKVIIQQLVWTDWNNDNGFQRSCINSEKCRPFSICLLY